MTAPRTPDTAAAPPIGDVLLLASQRLVLLTAARKARNLRQSNKAAGFERELRGVTAEILRRGPAH